MAKVKTFTTELEFVADELPGKPGDGQLQSFDQSAKRSLGSLANSGWSFRFPRVEPTEKSGSYKLIFVLRRQGMRRFEAEAAQGKSIQIRDKLLSYLPGWKVAGSTEEDVKEYTVGELLKFPENIHEYFSHIYDRDLHVREILDAIALARDTNMRVRQHILLHGYPGCAKSELCLAIAKIFGDLAVKKLDATSLTKAGAEKMLLEAPIVPPVIILEEIEKTAEVNLPWLLAVLDVRGELIKTTARRDVSRLTRCLVIATANNIEKLRHYQESALYDRFNHRLYCPLPDEALLRRILEREISNIPNGNPAWIEPAMEYALTVEKTYQARRVLAIMTLGRDRLLTGEYQEEHNRLRLTEDADAKRISEYNIQQ